MVEYGMFNYIPILMMMFEIYKSAIFSMMTLGIDAYITIDIMNDHRYWIRLNIRYRYWYTIATEHRIRMN
jgi:hypothetical protein